VHSLDNLDPNTDICQANHQQTNQENGNDEVIEDITFNLFLVNKNFDTDKHTGQRPSAGQ